MKILIVEDDRELAAHLRSELEHEGNAVTVCPDGALALQAAERGPFDTIVLDVMLPVIDGFELMRRLRRRHVQTPILMLTARDAPEDIVQGLDAGADDYLAKPFTFEVLLARIRARTRLPAGAALGHLRFADLMMDVGRREVWRGATAIRLTRTEFAILECLLRAAPRVVSRNYLIESVWNDREIDGNNLDVFMRFLRNKIDPPGMAKLLRTERGIGYVLRLEP